MTAELCTLCEDRPATTSWGLPVCDECKAFLGRLDVDLKAMEDADPELAAIAGRVTGWPAGLDPRSYSDRAREAIAARRKEQALPDPTVPPFRVGDRVRRRDDATTASDGTVHAPTGTVEATHYSHARPTVDVYWGTRAAGDGQASVREITTEAPETLEPAL